MRLSQMLVGLLISCSPAVQPLSEPAPKPRAASKASAPPPTFTFDTLASGARRIHIADPATFWRREGFLALAPPVRLAISAGSRPHVTVQLLVPEGEGIRATQLPDQARHTITFPPGSVADRVTMVRGEGGLTIADVRGSRIDAQGREWFHVYRPSSGRTGAALIGYEWLREDPAQREEATTLLVEHVRTTPRPARRGVPGRGSVAFFSRMNDCESCHFSNKAAGTDPDDWLPLWPTDQIGWYVPLAVMLPRLALSTTPQWHDPNADDALVARECAEGPPRERERRTGKWFRCADGSVPHGLRDVARGMLQGDSYTREVCRSRRYIYDRMDAAAREAFADVMAPCKAKR